MKESTYKAGGRLGLGFLALGHPCGRSAVRCGALLTSGATRANLFSTDDYKEDLISPVTRCLGRACPTKVNCTKHAEIHQLDRLAVAHLKEVLHDLDKDSMC